MLTTIVDSCPSCLGGCL